MGFVSLALLLGCVLFWGIVIMLITHSAWAMLISRYLLALILAFLLAALVLYVIKVIYKLLVNGNKKSSRTKDSATTHQVLDTDIEH